MRGPAARILGFALAAASLAAAAPASAAPASSSYDDGLAAYQRNDYDKSLKVLRPLAEKGDARAQYLVGRQYQFGQAVKADRAEAFYWYKRAEAKGHQEAKLFRLLLEKRWKITAGEKGRAERKIAADNAPKPAPQPARAQIESKPKPKPEKSIAEAPKPREKAKPAPSVAERAKPEPAKPAVETARAKLPDPPKPEPAKTKTETAKAKTPEKPAIVAARSTPGPEETTSTAPSTLPGRSDPARTPPRPTTRDDDDDDADTAPVARRYATPPTESRAPVARRYDPPPPESRTPVAAAPTVPPPSDEGTFDAPGYKPAAPNYAPPASPYYGPAPYYAPAAPPSWRATIYYGPGVYYPRHWGYRPYAGYMHPGWRGRGHRGRW